MIIQRMTFQRRFEIFKYYIKAGEKMEQEMEKIQDNLNKMEWTEENHLERIMLYERLGKILEKYRANRIDIKWYHKRLLEKSNLTG